MKKKWVFVMVLVKEIYSGHFVHRPLILLWQIIQQLRVKTRKSPANFNVAGLRTNVPFILYR
jgi:hypothetical protein